MKIARIRNLVCLGLVTCHLVTEPVKASTSATPSAITSITVNGNNTFLANSTTSFAANSTLSVNGVFGGTPQSGTLDLSNIVLTIPGSFTGTVPGANGGTGVANTGKTITLGGNLTTSGAFATTLTATGNTNVTLPTTGTLATQSEINARAPRQGLVFDDTTAASFTLSSAIGVHDYTAAAWVCWADTATNYVFGGNNCLGFYTTPTAISVQKAGVGGTVSASADFASGTWYHIAAVRASGNTTFFVNGTSIGSGADTNDLNGVAATLGSYNEASTFCDGTISSPLLFNRALSQSELTMLCNSSRPSSADHPPAPAGIALSPGVFSNYQYDTFSGATNAAFVAAEANGDNCEASSIIAEAFPIGTKFRVSFTAALTSGAVPTLYIVKSAVGTVSNYHDVTAGTNVSEFTLTASVVAGGSVLRFATSGNTSYEISGLSITPLGLTLAPEANAPGLGPQWSGVGMINLPADGVSGGVTWALPSARDAWFAYTRTSDGYVIGDQAVIPTGCYLADLWVSGDGGTVTIGESAGTPANVVASFSPASTPAPATLLVRTTSNRKLYVDLGTAATCTVKAHIVKFP